MIKGTDKALLEIRRARKVGRPKFDREKIASLIKARYSTQYIRKLTGASSRTIRLVKKEMREKGIITAPIDIEKLEREAQNFNEATKIAMGLDFGFYEWLKSKTKPNSVSYIFGFTEKCWHKFGSPSIVALKDREIPDADNFAMAWLQHFEQDKQRLRRRKKLIRNLFRFIGRHDINDRYFTMSRAREPIEKREVPEIEFIDFPTKLDHAIARLEKPFGIEGPFTARLKLVTNMRTGKGQRELWGIHKGKNEGSFIIMNNADEFVFKVKAKAGEEWQITWLPNTIRQTLWQIYQARKDGENLITIDVDEFRKAFKEVCQKHGLPPLHLHDLRKISLTWFYVCGVPLEIATSLNVGWKDLNTARDFYLHYRNLLTNDKKEAYKANIPNWFKEGLDQYASSSGKKDH